MPSPLVTEHAPLFLMCRPTYYTIAYEINPWMRLRRKPHHSRAVRQWHVLYRLLTQGLRVRVQLLPPCRGVPDLVFTANAGLVGGPHANGAEAKRGRTLIRSNFRHPQRQREEPIIQRYFKQAGYQIVTLPRRYNFEGEGDALWMGHTLLLGFRFRSDATVHERLARLLEARVLPVELVDTRFYHLDTCFAPLGERTALWYPDAFDRYGRRVIERLVPDLISVSEADAKRFVCNAIVAGRSVVVHEGSSARLRRQLTRRHLRLYTVDLSEFLKAGGAAKCLVLRLAG